MGKMVKFWLKRDFTNCAYHVPVALFYRESCKWCFIGCGTFIFSSVFESAQENCFKCGSLRASEFQGDL